MEATTQDCLCSKSWITKYPNLVEITKKQQKLFNQIYYTSMLVYDQ